MSDEIDKLRELERAATKGPWDKFDAERSDGSGREVFIQPSWAKSEFSDIICRDILRSDARFIAAFRNCAKELLDVVAIAEARRNGVHFPGELQDALDRLKAKVREVVK